MVQTLVGRGKQTANLGPFAWRMASTDPQEGPTVRKHIERRDLRGQGKRFPCPGVEYRRGQPLPHCHLGSCRKRDER